MEEPLGPRPSNPLATTGSGHGPSGHCWGHWAQELEEQAGDEYWLPLTGEENWLPPEYA